MNDNTLVDDCEEFLSEAYELQQRIDATDSETTEAILEMIISKLYTEATLRINYSGRNMYGRSCFGIVADDPAEVIELAAIVGIRGAQTDSMGRSTIVYWPDFKCANAEEYSDEE